MLRISGIVAFTLSALAATLLFSQVRSVEIAGVADGFDSGMLSVRALDRPGMPRPGRKEMFWFPAGMTSEDDGRPIHLQFEGVDPAAQTLPEGAEVRVSLRQLVITALILLPLIDRPFWTFEGLRIESGGRTYAWGASIPAFYTGLTLTCLAPLLLWSLVAVVIRYGRPKDVPKA